MLRPSLASHGAMLSCVSLLAISHQVAEPAAPSSLASDTTLLVLAAASLTDVLPQVGRLWEATGGVPIRFSFDATSRLAPQTLQGGIADLFFSADTRWMDWVQERDGLLEDSRIDVLGNELVMVVRAGTLVGSSRTEDQLLLSFRRIGLAGENVPAGRYAQAALESMGVWGDVEDRVVRAGNVRGALEWVARSEVDAAVVYRTDALVEPRVEVAYAFPDGSYPPVRYPAAVLGTSSAPDVARGFLRFCQSEAASDIFRRNGFTVLAVGGGEAGPDPMARGAEEMEPRGGAASPFQGEAGPIALPDPWSAIRISLLVALGATVVGFLPAVWIGWLLARKDFLGKSGVATLLMVPLVLPPVVTGFLLLSLLGSRSPVGAWLASLGAPVPFTLLGATVAALVVGFPLYVVSVRNAFHAVDPRYEEVSWTLGRHPWPTFLRISLPLALPGIAAGAILSFARGLGEFGATVVLAGNVEGSTRTIALAVYTLLESPQGRESIWVLVGASVALSLLALLGFEVLSKRQRRQMEGWHGR